MLARRPEDPQPAALAEEGLAVAVAEAEHPAALARELLDRARHGTVVWVGSPDGDPGLTDALAAEVARSGQAPEVEVLIGSWDTPGARLLDAVAVMDRLRSPGGCPWDAAQSHGSLVPYLLEEAHEAVEALESGDRQHMAEELGDVLLQVLFHARLAEEHEEEPFGVDEVAARLVEKLVRRHPHVFGDADASDAAAVEAGWERIKAQEKPSRTHPLEGVPAALPELSRAAKVTSRLERAGLGDWLRGQVAAAGDDRGAQLMAEVVRAREAGSDAAADLRRYLRQLEAAVPADATEPEGEDDAGS